MLPYVLLLLVLLFCKIALPLQWILSFYIKNNNKEYLLQILLLTCVFLNTTVKRISCQERVVAVIGNLAFMEAE